MHIDGLWLVLIAKVSSQDGMLYAKRRLSNETWHEVFAAYRLCCPLNVMLLEHAAGQVFDVSLTSLSIPA